MKYSAWRAPAPSPLLNGLLGIGLFGLIIHAGNFVHGEALEVAASPIAHGEDAKLEHFFRETLEESFQIRPSLATGLGVHQFDHLLDDISESARRDWLRSDERTLRELPRRVDYDELSRAGQIDYEIFRHDLEMSIWMQKTFHPFENDPRVYNRYLSGSVYALLAQSTMPLETNVSNCIARMRQFGRIVEEAKRTLRHPPAQHTDTAIKQNLGAIAFYEGGLFDLVGETKQRRQLKEAADQAAGILREYQKFLENELAARADGEWRLGRRKFYRKLELSLDAGMGAKEVLLEAEKEFARVRNEMYVVSRQLWSRYRPGLALPPDDAEGRRATIAAMIDDVSAEHGSPETLVDDARQTVDRIKKFIRDRDIIRLPDPDRCEIIEMPEFRRGNALAYLESAPPLEPAAASFYAISPPPSDWTAARVQSFLEEYNRHMLQILTIHEAYPGHYVQLEYSNRSTSFIRRILQSGVFIEGWAVYTEQMMLDQGYGDGDLALRLNQLKFYLRAVANAILDHKMHVQGMTEAEALSFLTEGAFQSEGEARLKIVRSKQSSVQLSTYFVGRMAHYRLRQDIQREWGESFDLGRFHEAVLDFGSVPVKYLPELVRARLRQPR